MGHFDTARSPRAGVISVHPLAVAALLGVAFTAPGSAQSAVTEGDRVRVRTAEGAVVVGEVGSASSREIRLLVPDMGRDVVIPGSEIERLERSLGWNRRFGRNLALTVLVTGVGAATAYAATWAPCGDCWAPSSRTGAFAAGAVGGAVLGAPIGVIVGLLVKHEEWEPVPLGSSRTPLRDRLGLQIRPIAGPRPGFSVAVAIVAR